MLSEFTPDVLRRAARVRLMIFDVDGVLTDGSLHFGPEGEVMKTFHVLDGHGIKLLQHAGILTAIISARQSAAVERRATDLAIAYLYQGVRDKRLAFEQLIDETGVAKDECGFVGDDIIDLPILCRAGFAASVPDAHPEVKSRVHYVTKAHAGRGAVREICDLVLHAQNKYEAIIASYIS